MSVNGKYNTPQKPRNTVYGNADNAYSNYQKWKGDLNDIVEKGQAAETFKKRGNSMVNTMQMLSPNRASGMQRNPSLGVSRKSLYDQQADPQQQALLNAEKKLQLYQNNKGPDLIGIAREQ